MRIPYAPLALRFAAAVLLLAGCSSDPDRADRPENPFNDDTPGAAKQLTDRELRLQADELYRHARRALDDSDYTVAITRYDHLIARYPFSDYSTQAELEKIYAQYKGFKSDEALSGADRFLRSHPRHPHADYVQYLKGVTDFERDEGLIATVGAQSSKRDVSNLRRAFEDFQLLLQKYPNSIYIGDARRRMLYARNRVAEHELTVARFYVARGAYVAAAKRASDIVSGYPGAPATIEALQILKRSYSDLGLQQQTADSATLIAQNSKAVTYTEAPQESATTVAALPVEAEPAPLADTDKQQPKGFMTRVAGWFDIFDTSKPENQHVLVIPTGAQPVPGTSGTDKPSSTSAPQQAPSGNSGAANESAPAPSGSTLHLSGHVPGTDDDSAKPAP